MDGIRRVPHLIRQLYSIVVELEEHFPGRRFTPDGHLVGSIGEVLAAHHHGLKLLPASTEGHDARTKDGRLVQVKTTQRTSIGLSSEPEHLLVLRILPDGGSEEACNGPGGLAWDNAGRMQSNGQHPTSLSRLTELMGNICDSDRLPKVAQ